MTLPRATVRLQMHRDFTFDDAAATVNYYARLGISHFYLSPILAARAGSTHGYDIVDPGQINPELGGEAGLLRLVEQLRAAAMGLVIDIVPNHMGVASSANRYWQDVLAWGRHSAYAPWFDIDWDAPSPQIKGKVLLPVLGNYYDEVLTSGDLQLRFDAAQGCLFIAYHEASFPLAAASYALVLGDQPQLAKAVAAFEKATSQTLEDARLALARLATTEGGQAALSQALAHYDPKSRSGARALHALLSAQHYRLSWWRNAAEEINWRRFFEVSDLAGVRVEIDEVFEATHALIFRLYERGLIDGVRVDHVDGLAEPAAYCQRLRQRLGQLQAKRPAPLNKDTAWIVVEKILSPGEALPADWQVDGSTGYDFMDQASAVLHDGPGEQLLGHLWAELTQDACGLDAHVQAARQQLLAENFVGEFDALARALHRYGSSKLPAGRDFALAAIRRVLGAFLASFRRYRTYATSTGSSDDDQAVMKLAFENARCSLHLPDHALLEHVTHWLGLGEPPDQSAPASVQALRQTALRRFQQLTPPLAAKSVEDTVFYRFAPLLSRNDVGSYPEHESTGIHAFHAANLQRAASQAGSVLATATHDHKRGEDTRARLAVLSEMPAAWAELLRIWMKAHAAHRGMVPVAGGGLLTAPCPADELLLYQTLFGAWPPGLSADDGPGIAAFAERVAAWQEKALREAKRHSSWMLPNLPYEAACRNFLMHLLCGEAKAEFLPRMVAQVEAVTPAANANALTQTLLRLTCPGVPDLYQGTEFADFSLVDPDNRRPVDMAARRDALDNPWPADGQWQTDLQLGSKQQLIRHALELRAHYPRLFSEGDYVPLEVLGEHRDHVLAFARRSGTTVALAIALRHPADLMGAAGTGQVLDWQDTLVTVPGALAAQWRNVLSGRSVPVYEGAFKLADVLGQDCVALLLGQPG